MRVYHRIISCFVLILIAGLYIQGAAQSNSHVTLPDTLQMHCDSSEGAVYQYIVRPKETLYSISKAFATDIFRLNELNPWLNERILDIGDTLTIPIREKIVLSRNPSKEAIPVVYAVKPGNNLFRICRICADIHERKILKVNDKQSPTLDPGERLLIGYFVPGMRDKTPDTTLQVTDHNIDRKEQNTYRGKYSDKDTEKHLVKERGVAVWNRSKSGGSNYYVLHKNAPVNSIMEVINPMNHRSVYAKVVGQLPDNTYPSEVIAVVSPAVANYLGVLDPRFYVQIRYRDQVNEVSRR